MHKHAFEELLLEAIDNGLSSLGESSKQAIYFHLEKRFHIKKQEIPLRVEDFTDAIEKIFGLGADFLEILIMKRLHEKIRGASKCSETADFTFVEYITMTRRSLLEENGVESMMEEFVQCEDMEIET